MSSYKLNPVTDEELSLWFKNKLVNPRTNRKIKEFSKTYNYLNINYKLMIKRSKFLEDEKNDTLKELVKKFQGPAQGDHLKSFDNKDPISQEDIWENSLEDNKKIVSEDIPSLKLFSYLDNDNKIRCFNIESFMSLVENDCCTHPITGLLINQETIDNAKKMFNILKENKIIQEVQDLRTEEQKISDYAFTVFQKFSLISIFIEHQWFIKMNEAELDKLYYETADFFHKNVNDENKKIMVPPDGKAFSTKVTEFKSFNFNKKQMYLLENIDIVISSSEDDGMKTLGKYLMIGGLGVVCKEVREKYPDFAYGFSLD
jgi:hypothetical protein